VSYSILNTIGENFALEAKVILEQLGHVDYKIPTQDELKKIIESYDVVLIGLGLTFSRDVLEKAKKLKIIATATTGLDHIDLDFSKERNIEVLSLKGETDFLSLLSGTAELGWGLIIDLLRKTPWAFDSVKQGEWQRERFVGSNLFGKTLGVVGLGRLGKWMARYGKAFGMTVIFTDPVVVDSELAKKVSFEELLEKSDVVSINVDLSPNTENLFAKREFNKMKSTAVLINTARGKVVNESDLLEALYSKIIAGYATDVLADEVNFIDSGILQNHPLVEYSKTQTNLLIAPHIGGMTVDSRIKTDVFIAHKIVNFLQNRL